MNTKIFNGGYLLISIVLTCIIICAGFIQKYHNECYNMPLRGEVIYISSPYNKSGYLEHILHVVPLDTIDDYNYICKIYVNHNLIKNYKVNEIYTFKHKSGSVEIFKKDIYKKYHEHPYWYFLICLLFLIFICLPVSIKLTDKFLNNLPSEKLVEEYKDDEI